MLQMLNAQQPTTATKEPPIQVNKAVLLVSIARLPPQDLCLALQVLTSPIGTKMMHPIVLNAFRGTTVP